MKATLLTAITLFFQLTVWSQTIGPDLQNQREWEVHNRQMEASAINGKNEVTLNARDGDGYMVLKDYSFTGGTVEFDLKGKNVPQRSFVGLTFHVQGKDEYEVVYFRPFNFVNPDTTRRSRAVQYVSMPEYPWEKLRKDTPGKYENKVNPIPDPNGWFHVKITVDGKSVRAYVDNSEHPCLEVESLGKHESGKIGLWVGNGSDGSFANLQITPAAEAVPYGNNPKAGKYVNVGDAKLYYEVYGEGEPFVLLHGGVYGYIDEFAPFLDKLIPNYQVICIATRGHGKSEIGTGDFTWQQRSEDALKVIRTITKDSVTVLGFSDGGYAGYKLAAMHPEVVKKLIVIGAGDRTKSRQLTRSNYSPEMLLGESKEYFESRLAMMPEPKRWGECLSKLNKLYNEGFLSTETFEKIQCPTLVMGGDRDYGHSVDALSFAYKAIRGSQLSIVPGCNHVVFYCNFPAVWSSIEPFLQMK